MSLVSETEETGKYKIKTRRDLTDMLTFIYLPSDWLVWYRDNLTTFILPSLRERKISIDLYLEINCFLSINAYANGQSISICANLISETISYLQILETERRLKLSSFLNYQILPYPFSHSSNHFLLQI